MEPYHKGIQTENKHGQDSEYEYFKEPRHKQE
jgi:hypothetical protein